MNLPESWKEGALGVIQKVLREPLAFKVINVVGGGDQDWALVELEANAVCKNGMETPNEIVLLWSDTKPRHAISSAVCLVDEIQWGWHNRAGM